MIHILWIGVLGLGIAVFILGWLLSTAAETIERQSNDIAELLEMNDRLRKDGRE